MKRNNEYTMKKYPLKYDYDDFFIPSDSHNVLFGFGAEGKSDNFYFRDICINKKDSQKKSYCKQFSYEYNGEENALCGQRKFDVKRIVVYEMEETDEMKQQREREEQEERESNLDRWKNEKEEVERRICQMTGKQVKEILFDSEINKWNKYDTEFDQIMKGKKEVIVLVEDHLQNLFGGYIGNEINIQQNIQDQSFYVFSLRKNGEFNPKKYERNNVGYSYWIGSYSDMILMTFGLNENIVCKDITLNKKDNSSGYCEQHCYNYNNEQFALCDKLNFNIKRIVVYQLN